MTTKKAQYTPGPWEEALEEEFNAFHVVAPHAKWEAVANDITSEANARLIALTPEMLQLLETIVGGNLLSPAAHSPAPSYGGKSVAQVADSILARARGES